MSDQCSEKGHGLPKTTKGLHRKARKPWPAVALLLGAQPSDVDIVGMRNGAEGGKQIPRVPVPQSWLPTGELGPTERSVGRCSPCLAGMCWQDATAMGGEGGSSATSSHHTSDFLLATVLDPNSGLFFSFLFISPSSGLHLLPCPYLSLALSTSSMSPSPLCPFSPTQFFLPVCLGMPTPSSPPCCLPLSSLWHHDILPASMGDVSISPFIRSHLWTSATCLLPSSCVSAGTFDRKGGHFVSSGSVCHPTLTHSY